MTDPLLWENRNPNEIIHETKHFYVKNVYGCVAPGQVMIIPKRHYPCIGAVEEELYPEFLALYEKVRHAVTKNYGNIMNIEYGVWGQSIKHAHIHFIPKKTDLYTIHNVEQEMILPSKVPYQKITLKELPNYYKQFGMYVLLIDANQTYLCDVRNTPYEKTNLPILYRRFLTNKGLLGFKNWKTMSEETKKISEKWRKATTKTLRKTLQADQSRNKQ